MHCKKFKDRYTIAHSSHDSTRFTKTTSDSTRFDSNRYNTVINLINA